MKVKTVLKARKLCCEVVEAEAPESDNLEFAEEKRTSRWKNKNDEALGIIVTTLSDEQAGQFLTESSARRVWDKLRETHVVDTIESNNRYRTRTEKHQDEESISNYIVRAKNIASRSIGFLRA